MRPYSLATALFFVLPLFTVIDIASQAVPQFVFYGGWLGFCALLAAMVAKCSSDHPRDCRLTLLALLLLVLSLALVFTSALPLDVLDNVYTTPVTARLADELTATGFLPSAVGSPSSYVNYPLSIVELAIFKMVAGIGAVLVPKILAIIPILLLPTVFYSLLKDKRVALTAAASAGLSPWIFSTATHYSPEAEAGLMLAIAVSILFAEMRSQPRGLFLPLLVISVGLAITDVFYGFVWVLLLLGLSASLTLLGMKGRTARTLVILFSASVLTWGAWYFLGSSIVLVARPILSIINQFLGNIAFTPKYFVSSGTVPLWVRISEYASYFTLGACTVLAAFYHLRRNPTVSALSISVVLVTVGTFLPWLVGYSGGTDLAQRSFYVFQIGAGIPVAYLLTSKVLTQRRFTVFAVIVALTLFSWNALLYGAKPYQYGPTFPFTEEDTRFNLQSWNGFGNTICQHSTSGVFWGVRLGVTFVGCGTYIQLSPSANNPKGEMSISGLLDLRSSVGHNKLVALRYSMGGIPEWPQALPVPVDQVFSEYDVVLTTGDPVLIYT